MEPRVYAAGARVYASLVIIVSAPVQRIGFWGFSVLVRTFGSGLGDCWDRGLGLGHGLDNTLRRQKKVQRLCGQKFVWKATKGTNRSMQNLRSARYLASA